MSDHRRRERMGRRPIEEILPHIVEMKRAILEVVKSILCYHMPTLRVLQVLIRILCFRDHLIAIQPYYSLRIFIS